MEVSKGLMKDLGMPRDIETFFERIRAMDPSDRPTLTKAQRVHCPEDLKESVR
jgi:hypothetical protein